MTAPRIWLWCDFNQAEARVVAWRGPVPKLKQWYSEGRDVHAMVTQDMARVIQQSKLAMPINPDTGKPLFCDRPWNEYVKGTEEREIGKRTVHANNYGLGVDKFALITNMREDLAGVVQKIYFTLFPEIKSGYQAWIEREIKKHKCLWAPAPVRFRKVFWGLVDDKLLRQAYASYPQITVASMLNRTLAHCSTIFRRDKDDKFKDQWTVYYGIHNWESWCRLREREDRSPQAILWGGMDIRLNVHDAGGISIPNDPDLVRWCAETWRSKAEEPIVIEPGNELVIPVDFKIGRTWGHEDLRDYKTERQATP